MARPGSAGTDYHGTMAAPTPEEAVEAARQAEQRRLETVRTLAEARQHADESQAAAKQERADLEARLARQIGETERAVRRAWKSALSAGWTPTGLHKIGFQSPGKPTRRRRDSGSSARAENGSDDEQHSAPDLASQASDAA